jgi:glycosyltransferase involved in cell wall biosynthesis
VGQGTDRERRDLIYSSINIVIPVYNEGENILKTLDEIKAKVKTPHQIFIVYDFDEDNTLPAVNKYNQASVILVKNKCGKGALSAIKTGFDAVRDGIVLVVMADLSDDLIVVDEMFNKINEGYDIVCGSRFMRGGRHIGGPFLKSLISKWACLSLYYLVGFPTHDVTNSFKMYTKKVLSSIMIESNGGFELGMEICVKAYVKGFKIAEVPSTWHDRSVGQSRFKLWQWLPKYLHWYFFAVRKRLFG